MFWLPHENIAHQLLKIVNLCLAQLNIWAILRTNGNGPNRSKISTSHHFCKSS
ncbi:hypothetical protein CAter282_2979 [Collimonas arenae]|uniref:Uncharacterized protein n=1 Tax=Collimonas arenae TaxID=279058 RepID=A0A127PSS6_9BURK|nr:hypothetical protein CAter10_3277 [Collimonas arenae]AMP10700.1 hypothetical protein CAter282_2979 [Collimonas arenae]